MQLKIRQNGDKCLREKSQDLLEITSAERMIFEVMIETMYKAKGVGLAASQVGINKRFFVADIGDGPMVVINPEILRTKGSETIEEGCLSVEKETVAIKRPKEILVKYLDENNKKVETWYRDLTARVFLHEIDHLDGKLIIDYAKLEDNIEFQKQHRVQVNKKEQL